jgi:hypothetical protein
LGNGNTYKNWIMSSSRSNEDVMNIDISRKTSQKPYTQRKQGRKAGSNPKKEGQSLKAQEGKIHLLIKVTLET